MSTVLNILKKIADIASVIPLLVGLFRKKGETKKGGKVK